MYSQHLTTYELGLIDSAVEVLAKQAKFSFTFDDLLKRWSNFVTATELGYEDSIYEYTNDLATRDVIQRVLLGIPESLSAKVIEIVQCDDDRFLQATRKIERSLADRKSFEDSPWWFRVPRKMSDELRNDLESEGLLDT